MIWIPIIGRVDRIAALGLACGVVALVLFLFALCVAAAQADLLIDIAIADKLRKADQSWPDGGEPFDFKVARARARATVNCDQAGDRQWL